ncbi:hypothetical protein [Zavarzinia compransoris]|uniref:hypothetical protein n=1 Tax=Zavarzinia compransoris TaxID=1264899 RepID=UPI00105C682B|nr:hypothetical protein [Zavarzinia compransoris]
MISGLALGAAVAAVALPVQAADMLRPRVDYSATYRIDPDGMVMTMSHHAGRMRIDTDEGGRPATILMDPVKRVMFMLADGMAMKISMDQPLPGAGKGLTPTGVVGSARYTPVPLGTKVIAGLGCTVYEAFCEGDGGKPVRSEVCLTDDMVMLEAVSKDQGQPYVMTATSVSLKPQDPARFEVPKGMQVMDMSQMLGGLGAMGVPGMPRQ